MSNRRHGPGGERGRGRRRSSPIPRSRVLEGSIQRRQRVGSHGSRLPSASRDRGAVPSPRRSARIADLQRDDLDQEAVLLHHQMGLFPIAEISNSYTTDSMPSPSNPSHLELASPEATSDTLRTTPFILSLIVPPPWKIQRGRQITPIIIRVDHNPHYQLDPVQPGWFALCNLVGPAIRGPQFNTTRQNPRSLGRFGLESLRGPRFQSPQNLSNPAPELDAMNRPNTAFNQGNRNSTGDSLSTDRATPVNYTQSTDSGYGTAAPTQSTLPNEELALSKMRVYCLKYGGVSRQDFNVSPRDWHQVANQLLSASRVTSEDTARSMRGRTRSLSHSTSSLARMANSALDGVQNHEVMPGDRYRPTGSDLGILIPPEPLDVLLTGLRTAEHEYSKPGEVGWLVFSGLDIGRTWNRTYRFLITIHGLSEHDDSGQTDESFETLQCCVTNTFEIVDEAPTDVSLFYAHAMNFIPTLEARGLVI